MIKRKSWQDYQKEIADDHYYYARSCIRQNFFPGSEKLFIDMLRNDLGRDLTDDPLHSSCTGIGYHSDIVPLETIMTVVARQFALFSGDDEVFVIGGAQIYAQALPLADRFYLTRVFRAYEGDTHFPEWDEAQWRLLSSESFASGANYPYPFAFETYERRRN